MPRDEFRWPHRGVRYGATTGDRPKDIEMFVKVSLPSSSEHIRGGRLVPQEGDKRVSGNAETVSREALERGRQEARQRVRSIAESTAAWARSKYAALGFDFRVVVRPSGSGYRLVVEGDEKTQMLARILEGGAGGVMMHDFIRKAQRRREIQVTRTRGGKVSPRGKISEREEGSYMIIPVVHGKVTRGEDGKLKVAPLKDGQLEEDLAPATLAARRAIEGYQRWNALAQFEATPSDTTVHLEDDGEGHRDGSVEWKAKRMYNPDTGRTGTLMTPERREVGGERMWETVKYRQSVRKPGVVIEIEGGMGPLRKKGQYVRDSQQDPALSRATQQRATQKGAKLISALGAENLRVNSPEATLGQEGSETAVTVRRQQGEVVSFKTISTRQDDRVLFKGRAAQRVLGKAMDQLRDALREDMRVIENSKMSKYRQRGMLEIYQQALR